MMMAYFQRPYILLTNSINFDESFSARFTSSLPYWRHNVSINSCKTRDSNLCGCDVVVFTDCATETSLKKVQIAHIRITPSQYIPYTVALVFTDK